MNDFIEIKCGDIFYPADRGNKPGHNHKRVVGVVGNLVFFSVGGDRNYSCRIDQLLRWSGNKVSMRKAKKIK